MEEITISLVFNTILSSVVVSALISSIVSLINNQKKRFNETVTQKRIEYLVDMRNTSAELCSLVVNENSINKEKKDFLYYKLCLMLNPSAKGAYWDEDLIQRLDKMYKTGTDVNVFVRAMQANLSLEWHGLMREGKKGKLSKRDKESLRLEKYKDLLEYEK